MRALENAASRSRTELSRHTPALPTYFGHATPAQACWYVEATPVLCDQVSAATGRLHSAERATKDVERPLADFLSTRSRDTQAQAAHVRKGVWPRPPTQ